MRYIILFALLLNENRLLSQGITGTWEGVMGHEFLQVNIKEDNGKLCGYTYDHFLSNRREYCKAWFTGGYDKNREGWLISGKQFIENSGSHVLMRLWLWRESSEDKNILGATVTTRSALGFLFPQSMGENIILRRVARNPQPLPGNLPTCLPEPQKPKPPVTKKPVPKPPPANPVPANPFDTIQSPDTNVKRKPVITTVNPGKDTPVLQKMIARKRKGISRLEVNVKHIILAVYDNAIIDGDTVSIFFNGKLLVDKQLLSAKPLTINIDLNENITVNEIVLYAENLGSIPPNTALIVVTAGDKRYELHSSASLEENAVLVFDYKPK